jgi:cytoskeletal protein CcmA (bactofilin family)
MLVYALTSRLACKAVLPGRRGPGLPPTDDGSTTPRTRGGHCWPRHLAAVLIVLTALLAAAPPAQAMEFRQGDTVLVPPGTVIDDDLFATGQTLTIAGQVNGEVYAFGQTIMITGVVQRDLIAAGQQVTVDGNAGGDLRAAGQQVTINGRVDGNATTAGQTVLIGRQGAIGDSLLGAAQTLTLLGPVGRNVTAAATTLALGSTVGRDVNAHVETLTVDPGARIEGRLDYTGPQESALPAGVAAGGVQFYPQERAAQPPERGRENPLRGLFGWFGLVWLIGSIILGVLLVHFLPGFAASTAAQVLEHPLPSFGLGILAFFVVPAALFFVAITLIGLPIAFLGGIAYLAGLYLGWLLLGLAVGDWLVRLIRRGREAARPVDARWLVVLGLVVLYVLTNLPFIGGLIAFVGLCLGLGALLRQLAAMRPQRQPPPPVPAPLPA